MFSDLMKALRQLGDPASQRIVVKALVATLICFIVLWIPAFLGFSWLGDSLAGWAASGGAGGFWQGIIEFLVSATAVAAIVFVSFILFPAAVALALSFLLDDICEAVEARYYPDLPPARGQPMAEMLGDAARLLLVTVGVNILLLPLYLLFLFLPPFNLFLFYGVNGYLLGREYFEVAAVRRLESKQARALRQSNRWRVFGAGVIVAILLTIPLVNLVMPVVATALMVHVFEGLRRKSAVKAAR
jgi:uncharacterized protein involved in cysteine biosynthesis